jgi:hypothetical protein
VNRIIQVGDAVVDITEFSASSSLDGPTNT